MEAQQKAAQATKTPEINELTCCKKLLEFILQKRSASYVPEIANCPTCKAYYERKPGSAVAYKLHDEDKGFNCTKCGSEIMAGRVAHPIWDFPEAMGGFGKCAYENVPYCPKCEKEPNFHGAPIQVK